MIFRLKEDNFSIDQLAVKAKAGDKNAFGDLYEALVEKIYRFIFFKVSDKETAEDLTQEVFLKIIKNLKNYKDDGTFLAWAYTIARNLVIDHYRSEKPKISLESIQDSLQSDEPDFEVKEAYEALIVNINKLTTEEQEVLTLHSIEQYSFEEIAKITGKSEGALRVIKYRSLLKLKKLMNYAN